MKVPEILYVLGETLEDLNADAGVLDYAVAPLGPAMRLDFRLRPGRRPFLKDCDGQSRLSLLLSPDRLLAEWVDPTLGAVHAIFGADNELSPEDLRSLANCPLDVAAIARHQDLLVPGFILPASPVQPRGVRSDTIAMLLRHKAVTDLFLAADGFETSLQFQVAEGYADVSTRPGRDWVGLDMSMTSADICWFGADDTFRLHSFKWGDAERGAMMLVSDPLGFVLSSGEKDSPSAPPLATLLGKIESAFSLS